MSYMPCWSIKLAVNLVCAASHRVIMLDEFLSCFSLLYKLNSCHVFPCHTWVWQMCKEAFYAQPTSMVLSGWTCKHECWVNSNTALHLFSSYSSVTCKREWWVNSDAALHFISLDSLPPFTTTLCWVTDTLIRWPAGYKRPFRTLLES